ncbi:substrate-binding domain-containing protein [Actinoplanes sp. M2I2]|uniref:substrate-binding domain-containing protein n=1 Tax=Actinoplanes sp. M2I2 TaxID=1734444 RepID=UPI002020911A|nr:substrate-binding domain-containing protein [Actinoplanes sp. M2I2]
MRERLRRTAIALTVALAVVTAAGCSKSGDDTGAAADTAPPADLPGSITFNDDNLGKITAEIKKQMAGKSVADVNVAMVINNPSAFWREGEAGLNNAAKELGVKAEFQAPQGGDLTRQLSILDTLRAQKVSGYTLSAVDPAAVKGPVDAALGAGIDVVAIDSPLPGTREPVLYLGTPNFDAGVQAGEAMKKLLNGKGEVAILAGSLTAANATQRIAGFTKAIEGTDIKIVQTLTDDADPAKALSNAQTALQANPNLGGIYAVWSYVGPAVGQAVQAAGKAGKVQVVADDAEPKTVQFVKDGVIQAMILQRPYQQGYLGVYLLTAMKVLGPEATAKIVEPYLTDASGVRTLSSGIGLVTRSNLEQFQSGLAELGVPAQ